ncbi:hypothetical protein Tco_0482263 [Tanacetum coccineum]
MDKHSVDTKVGLDCVWPEQAIIRVWSTLFLYQVNLFENSAQGKGTVNLIVGADPMIRHRGGADLIVRGRFSQDSSELINGELLSLLAGELLTAEFCILEQDFESSAYYALVCIVWEKIMERHYEYRFLKSISNRTKRSYQTPAEDTEETESALTRYNADIRATNILLQGIPKDIYTLIFHYTDGQRLFGDNREDRFWKGSELIKVTGNHNYTNEFECFCQSKERPFYAYYVRFITEVKLNRGLKGGTFDQLYAYLKQHEVHANENRMMMERFIQPIDDPLALVSNASNQKYPTQSSESPQSSNQPSIVDNCQMDTGSTSTDNLIESLTNTLALLNQSFKAHLPQTNNQLRTSSNARNNATVQDGRVVVQDVRGRYNANNQGRPFQRNNARGNVVAGNAGGQNRVGNMTIQRQDEALNVIENGVVLDEEQLLFLAGEQVTNFDDDVDDLALNVDHVFETDQCDAFDSDVDEAFPTHRTVQWQNLSSEDPKFILSALPLSWAII